jgi:hypothetical protein
MKNIVKGLTLALVVVFAFTSCAKQPTQLMDAAKAAIQGVVDAKGGVYAKDELAKLNGDLQAALDEVTAQSKKFFKKFGPAKDMLPRSKPTPTPSRPSSPDGSPRPRAPPRQPSAKPRPPGKRPRPFSRRPLRARAPRPISKP